MARIVILFLPFLMGLMWEDISGVSIAWSLAGSGFIAAIAQTQWFRQSDDVVPFTHRLLRPGSIYHFYFLGLQVVGAGFRALDMAGYNFSGQVGLPWEDELSMIAAAQQLMLLAHASVTAGMKLVGFRYGRPKYVIPSIPPYALIVISFVSLAVGTIGGRVPGLGNIGGKLFEISSTAILLEIVLSIRRRRFANMVLTMLLLGFNLYQQVTSGWKGLVLWTTIPLAAMLYPLMPKRVILGGTALILIFLLYVVPFGISLRALSWYGGVDKDTAVSESLDEALKIDWEERLNKVWILMSLRASDLYQFGKYLDYVPNARPYYGFDLVKEALMGFVPRIIWPEKPDLEKVAMQRVYDAGVVPEESEVSAKSNFYQDAYLSGGWLAIVLACLIFGMLAMLISRACERLFGGYDIGTCLIYTSLFANSFNISPNFLFLVGTIWGSLLTLFAIFVLGRFMGWIMPASPSAIVVRPVELIKSPPSSPALEA